MQTSSLFVGTFPFDQSEAELQEPLTALFHESVHAPAFAAHTPTEATTTTQTTSMRILDMNEPPWVRSPGATPRPQTFQASGLHGKTRVIAYRLGGGRPLPRARTPRSARQRSGGSRMGAERPRPLGGRT